MSAVLAICFLLMLLAPCLIAIYGRNPGTRDESLQPPELAAPQEAAPLIVQEAAPAMAPADLPQEAVVADTIAAVDLTEPTSLTLLEQATREAEHAREAVTLAVAAAKEAQARLATLQARAATEAAQEARRLAEEAATAASSAQAAYEKLLTGEQERNGRELHLLVRDRAA